MIRTAFFAAASLAALLAFAACNADVQESCISGACDPTGTTSTTSATSSSQGGGGGGPTCDNTTFPTTGDYPCEVWQVLHDRCHCCHQDPTKGGAPFPLLSYEDAHAVYNMTTGKLRWERMKEVVQPDGLPHMPFSTAKDTTAAQRKVLSEWLDACAPPAESYGDGGPGCDGSMPPPAMCDPP